MNLNNRRIKFYTEAGLAVLLVLTMGLAGMRTRADGADEETVPVEAMKDTQTQKKETGVQTGENSGYYPIMGESSVTVEDMENYFYSSGKTYPAEELAAGGAESLEAFCTMYYEEARAEGVRPEVAFAQTMKETGFLQYGGDADISQFNFAGLGTTGGGVPGNSYPDVRTGIRAQIQHLKAYATADPLIQECDDDRYEYVKKGAAPYVEWLGQQENPEGLGWATGDNYGYDIADMIGQIMTKS